MVNKSTFEIKGAVQTNYLLEKSRLIEQTNGERNYHIFYHLFKGAPKSVIESLHLLDDHKKYAYLNKSDCHQIVNVNDTEKFQEILKSFHVKSFNKWEKNLL